MIGAPSSILLTLPGKHAIYGWKVGVPFPKKRRSIGNPGMGILAPITIQLIPRSPLPMVLATLTSGTNRSSCMNGAILLPTIMAVMKAPEETIPTMRSLDQSSLLMKAFQHIISLLCATIWIIRMPAGIWILTAQVYKALRIILMIFMSITRV